MEKVHEVLSDIASLAGCTPKEIGESKEWACIVEKTEASRINLCELLEGETLFSALYQIYTLTFTELKKVLQNSEEKSKAGNIGASNKPKEGLKDQKRKRRSSNEVDRPEAAKKQGAGSQQTKLAAAPLIAAQPTTTKNFFAPLADIETEDTTENKGAEEGSRNSQGNRSERPPPIIITAQLNLLRLQGEIKASTKVALNSGTPGTGQGWSRKKLQTTLPLKNC